MTTETPAWATGPLHNLLVKSLPAFVREPFSESPRLDITRVRHALEVSHETVYKWLRDNSLRRIRNAQSIVRLCNDPENLAVLKKLSRKPATIKDFYDFIA